MAPASGAGGRSRGERGARRRHAGGQAGGGTAGARLPGDAGGGLSDTASPRRSRACRPTSRDERWAGQQEGSGSEASAGSDLIKSRPFGLRQESDGAIAPCPLAHLLLLRGARDVAPATGPGMRSLREIARQEPRLVRLRHPRKVAVRGRGGNVGGYAMMASDRASIMWRGAWGGWMTPSLDRSIQRPAEAARDPALTGADATAQRTRTRTRRRALPTAARTRNP